MRICRRTKVQCREIGDADVPGVVDCLARNFPRRTREFWLNAIDAIGARPRVLDLPRYGQLLEAEGRVVGVLLQIYTNLGDETEPKLRCNLSSWCVDAAFRSFSVLLHKSGVQRKSTTYLNISSAPHTRKTIEALGFRRYAEGRVFTLPLMAPPTAGARITVYEPGAPEAAGLTELEQRVLADHRAAGLHALVGVRDGVATPFVLKWRALWRHPVPTAQILYCRGEQDIRTFAYALGRYAARFGRFGLIISANGPIEGLKGKYYPDREPRYFLGPEKPEPSDLAYTELVLLGR